MSSIEHAGTTTPANVRWLIRRDMDEVLVIENACFSIPWIEDDFLRCLRQRNCIGMVAEREGRIVGYMLYTLHRKRARLLNFAVREDCQSEGVGRQMMERLVEKTSQQGRRQIIAEVCETNLDGQLFFRAMGFVALKVLRGRYDDTDADAYLMSYAIGTKGGES